MNVLVHINVNVPVPEYVSTVVLFPRASWNRRKSLFLFLPLILFIILHLHQFPHSRPDNLDEHTLRFLDDEEAAGAGAG